MKAGRCGTFVQGLHCWRHIKVLRVVEEALVEALGRIFSSLQHAFGWRVAYQFEVLETLLVLDLCIEVLALRL